MYANRWMAVREDTVRRPDGSTGLYGVVDSPDIALVIPADGDRLHLVEQYRHPVAGRCWEFPAGSADQRLDVDAAALAARELREETGLVAGSLTQLGWLDTCRSTCTCCCCWPVGHTGGTCCGACCPPITHSSSTTLLCQPSSR